MFTDTLCCVATLLIAAEDCCSARLVSYSLFMSSDDVIVVARGLFYRSPTKCYFPRFQRADFYPLTEWSHTRCDSWKIRGVGACMHCAPTRLYHCFFLIAPPRRPTF